VFIGARSDPELKAAQAQKSELSQSPDFVSFGTRISVNWQANSCTHSASGRSEKQHAMGYVLGNSQTWPRRILQSIAAFVRALGLLPESSLLGVKFKFSLRQTLSGEIRGRPHSAHRRVVEGRSAGEQTVSAVSLVRRIALPGFALPLLCGCASHERPFSAPTTSQPRAARECV
jgi:hypothetical protein